MEKKTEADWHIIANRSLSLFVVVVKCVVEEVRDLVLLVGDEVGIGFEDDGLGVADPPCYGAVAHAFGQ